MKIVILTDEERKRLAYLLALPVPPGLTKDMDVRLLKKIGYKL